MQNNFLDPKDITNEALNIYSHFQKDSLYKTALNKSLPSIIGFWNNEKYNNINITDNIRNLVAKGVKVYAIYGKDDGLYSKEQVWALGDMIGRQNLQYFDRCSHAVFIDQQTAFIKSFKKWMVMK